MNREQELAQATFGGGCFWCTEAVFKDVLGVRSVLPGYAGGHVDDPTYEQVCTGTTGHAEVIRITYDPAKISYRTLLDIFFATHDPTTPDRQGNDVGPQYRSVVFAHDEAQAVEAREAIKDLDARGIFDADIVTAVEPLSTWFEAEDYHRNYFENNPTQGYCSVVIAPKVAKFRATFRDLLSQAA